MIKDERGITLIEVLIAVALLSIIGVAFLSGLATASKAIFVADERATAESLARSQMEYVKNQPYAASYPETIPAEFKDAGYSAEIEVGSVPDAIGGIQKITVKIYHHDDAHVNPPVITLEDYKVN